MRARPFLFVFGALLLTTMASAAEPNDYFFPGHGKVAVRAATGVPFAAAGEIGVGIGSRFAVGTMVAAGPFQGGVAFGVYPRVDALHVGPMRLTLEAPLIWYPGIAGAENWLLFRPMARLEGAAGPVRVHGSFGAIVAKMVGADAVEGPIAAYGGAGLPSGVQRGAVWNTWGVGSAVALSGRTSIFGEAFVMTRGFELAGPEWFRIPAGGLLGVATTL